MTERAWHSLFIRNMFIQEHDPAVLEAFEPDFTVVDANAAGPVSPRGITDTEGDLQKRWRL